MKSEDFDLDIFASIRDNRELDVSNASKNQILFTNFADEVIDTLFMKMSTRFYIALWQFEDNLIDLALAKLTTYSRSLRKDLLNINYIEKISTRIRSQLTC